MNINEEVNIIKHLTSDIQKHSCDELLKDMDRKTVENFVNSMATLNVLSNYLIKKVA